MINIWGVDIPDVAGQLSADEIGAYRDKLEVENMAQSDAPNRTKLVFPEGYTDADLVNAWDREWIQGLRPNSFAQHSANHDFYGKYGPAITMGLAGAAIAGPVIGAYAGAGAGTAAGGAEGAAVGGGAGATAGGAAGAGAGTAAGTAAGVGAGGAGLASLGGGAAAGGTAAGTAGAVGAGTAAGAGGAAAGGIGAGTYLAGGSALAGLGGALISANASNVASNRAANATNAATLASNSAQERMYQQGRADFAPFRDIAPESLATLQSAVYGGPRTYTDVNGQQQTANGQQFDLANFKPEETAAYDWQKSRTLEDLGNYFNLTGRGRGSTVQSNATGRALGDLNAAEYDKGYNRLFQRKQDYTNDLLNLVKTAQGAAGTTSALGSNAANQTSAAYQNQGNTLANLQQSNGQTQANLYAGIAPAAINTIGTGLKLNDYYNNQPAANNAPVYINGEYH